MKVRLLDFYYLVFKFLHMPYNIIHIKELCRIRDRSLCLAVILDYTVYT